MPPPQLVQPSITVPEQPQGALAAQPQLEQVLQVEHVVQQPARRALRASRRVKQHEQVCASQPQGAAAEQPHGSGAGAQYDTV